MNDESIRRTHETFKKLRQGENLGAVAKMRYKWRMTGVSTGEAWVFEKVGPGIYN
jgi:hypothetical protein